MGILIKKQKYQSSHFFREGLKVYFYLADPGAQQADADLAVVIEVGVEAPAAL
jgi:hypothetical protein